MLFRSVDQVIAGEAAKISRTSKPLYKKRQSNNEIPWCIASVPTFGWAKKVFPNSSDPKQDLENAIFKMCFIDKEDPLKEWDDMCTENSKRCELLNKYNFKELHYQNSLGTDLHVCLNKDALWAGGAEYLQDGRLSIMNLPTVEVFTTPFYNGTTGVVYSSKPLVYNGVIMDEFMIEFKDGRVINYTAKKGLEMLKSIIEADEYSAYLGEAALVEHESMISSSNILFYETLYDENASCHLALGNGFPSCVKNALDNSKLELLEKGINQSDVHVDFMIGTKDLNIIIFHFL